MTRLRRRATFFAKLERFLHDRNGNYGLATAIAMVPLMTAVAVSIEYTNASRLRSELQQHLDAAVLAGAREDKDQEKHAEVFFRATYRDGAMNGDVSAENKLTEIRFELGDGYLDGWAKRPMGTIFGIPQLTEGKMIGVYAQARFKTPEAMVPCITVLSEAANALRVNSGANVLGKDCEIHVHSRRNPSMIMNGGSTLDVERTCVAGTNILHNGGKIGGLATNCKVPSDPYAGKIPEPQIPAAYASAPTKTGNRYTVKAGRHRGFNINDATTIIFEPGLHIIEETINIAPGSTLIAEGVTFFFRRVDAELRVNGGLTMKASAPKSGPYKGILMFEKPGSQRGPFIFNGSSGEQLEGVIYLPNRDVIYNSTTNVGANRMALVVNTLIINSANWKIAGLTGAATGQKTIYLSH